MKYIKILATCTTAFGLYACGSDSGTSPNDTLQQDSTGVIEEVNDVVEEINSTKYICVDGSEVTDAELCPKVIDKVTGEEVAGVADSVVTKLYVCSDGSQVEDASACPTIYICNDGSKVDDASKCKPKPSEDSSEILSSSSEQEQIPSSSSLVTIPSTDKDTDDEDGVSDEVDATNPGIAFAAPSAATVTNDNGCITVNATSVEITCAGKYNLSGSASEQQVIVNTPSTETENVHLYLNGLTLTSSDAPILVKNAPKTIFHIVKGTTSSLTDGTTRKAFTKADGSLDTANAVIYAKDDINFKGSGTLNVIGKCNYTVGTDKKGNGIHSSNDIKIKNGTINVSATVNAIKGKGSVQVTGGTLNLTAASGDGIKSDEGEDEGSIIAGKGMVKIRGGEVTITKAGDDGIQAYNAILVDDSVSVPTIKITSTGKGMVSTNSMFVNGGNINITASDDGIHSNMNVYMNAGNVTISSGDDGIHADSTLRLSGSTINITKATEGMEAYYIRAEGGITATYGTDDGWNAAGGTDGSGNDNNSGWGNFGGGFGGGMQSSSKGYIIIDGGYHYISASGNDIDVLDANGTATQNGGVVILEIPSSSGGSMGGMGGMGGRPGSSSGSGNGCSTNMAGGLIDTDNGFTIKGGVLLAFGNQTEEYPNCSAVSYTSSNYYGSSNAAFKPQGSGSMIVYGGSVTSVAQVSSTAGMTEVKFPNGLSYMYK